jgi:hypothetical protein
MRSNPEIILLELDRLLQKPVELTIFGSSALNLAYPGDVGELTRDIDLIIPAHDIPRVNENMDFWEAQTALNERLKPAGLYMTHIFEDHQVILTKDWVRNRVPIAVPFCSKVSAFRPSTGDLILTKMMRNDSEDKEHVSFLLRQEAFSDAQLCELFKSALVPDVPEIATAFLNMKNWVRFENDRQQQLRRP